MDPNSVAIVAIGAGALTTLGVPFIQGRINSRNDRTVRRHDRLNAAYAEASLYMDAVQAQLYVLRRPIEIRRANDLVVDVPKVSPISAQMRLWAPSAIFEAWMRLTRAHEWLILRLAHEGPNQPGGQYMLWPDDPDDQAVQDALDHLTALLREEAGSDAIKHRQFGVM